MIPSSKPFKLSTLLQPTPFPTQNSTPSAQSSSKDHSLPSHHLPNRTGFKNPWPSASAATFSQASSSSLNSSCQSASATNTTWHLPQLINRGFSLPIEFAKKLETDLNPIKTIPSDLTSVYSQHHHQNQLNKLLATWLGHAGYLVQLPLFPQSHPLHQSVRLLFDPIFSNRAGPTQWTGPKRFLPPPCHIDQLPRIDYCLISHSHYDHLDFDTIKELEKLQPHLVYCVPLGLKSWFSTIPVQPETRVVEMDWWDSFTPTPNLPTSTSPEQQETGHHSATDWQRSISIHCVPAQHSSGRSLLNQNTTLWCGWVVEQTSECSNQSSHIHSVRASISSKSHSQSRGSKTREVNRSTDGCHSYDDGLVGKRWKNKCSVYFAGDTGYRNSQNRRLVCPAFKEIGKRFGPIDFSMIPIWRGGSLSFISWAGLRLADVDMLATHHATPEDALKIHIAVRSKNSIGIHHSCFVGHEAESLESLVELEKSKAIAGVSGVPGGFGVVDVGETVELEVGTVVD